MKDPKDELVLSVRLESRDGAAVDAASARFVAEVEGEALPGMSLAVRNEADGVRVELRAKPAEFSQTHGVARVRVMDSKGEEVVTLPLAWARSR